MNKTKLDGKVLYQKNIIIDGKSKIFKCVISQQWVGDWGISENALDEIILKKAAMCA